jgi:hypothetical protein
MGRNVLAAPWLIKPPAAESRELEGTESPGNSLAATGALIPYGGSRIGHCADFRYYAAFGYQAHGESQRGRCEHENKPISNAGASKYLGWMQPPVVRHQSLTQSARPT